MFSSLRVDCFLRRGNTTRSDWADKPRLRWPWGKGHSSASSISGESQRSGWIGVSWGHITIPELITGIKAPRVVGAGQLGLEQMHLDRTDPTKEEEPLLPSGGSQRGQRNLRGPQVTTYCIDFTSLHPSSILSNLGPLCWWDKEDNLKTYST